MNNKNDNDQDSMDIYPSSLHDPLRFHHQYSTLNSTFGDTWFARKAEAFARFFGTPFFLGAQTLVVGLWTICNLLHIVTFDPYPFVLLNLAFSLQSAYAAPLILLAQTRQAGRDKASAKADAEHREYLAQENINRQRFLENNAKHTLDLVKQNTELTQLTNQLAQKIEILTAEVHKHITDNSH